MKQQPAATDLVSQRPAIYYRQGPKAVLQLICKLARFEGAGLAGEDGVVEVPRLPVL